MGYTRAMLPLIGTGSLQSKITVLGPSEDTCTEAPGVSDLRDQDQPMYWPGSSGLVPWQEVVLGEMKRIGMSGVGGHFF